MTQNTKHKNDGVFADGRKVYEAVKIHLVIWIVFSETWIFLSLSFQRGQGSCDGKGGKLSLHVINKIIESE